MPLPEHAQMHGSTHIHKDGWTTENVIPLAHQLDGPWKHKKIHSQLIIGYAEPLTQSAKN